MIEMRDGKASITFHDVAAYFPEEEWKLLQDWQKEIYKDVMKEIHHTLITLGHKIINRGNILQIKKREELHILNRNYSERRANLKDLHSPSHPAVVPDIFLKIKPAANVQTSDVIGSKQTNFKDSLVKGPSTTSFLARNKDEKVPYSIDQINKQNMSKITKATDDPVITSVFSLRLEHEEGAAITKSPEPEKVAPEKPIITSVFSLNIKCEEGTEVEKEPGAVTTAGHPVVKDAYSGSFKYVEGIRVKVEPFPEELTASDTTGDAAKRKLAEGVGCLESTPIYKDAVGKVKIEEFQSCHQKANSSSSLWSGMNSERAGNTLYSGTSRLEKSRTHGYEGNLRNVGLIPELPNDPQSWRPFKCTECEAYFSLSEDLYRHEQAHKQQVYHQCTKCEKRFVLKEELAAHQKTHVVLCIPEVAPVGYINLEGKVTSYSYQCTKCDKSFSLKESLNVHLKTHVEVKPYQCTMCEKSFFQEVIFIRHLKTHSGERPFSCTQCGINFTHKVGLQTHQRRQACKKPYPFPVYTKCFVQLGDRVSVEATNFEKTKNTEEAKNTNADTPKPFKCTHCEKRFRYRISLIKHERSHTQ